MDRTYVLPKPLDLGGEHLSRLSMVFSTVFVVGVWICWVDLSVVPLHAFAEWHKPWLFQTITNVYDTMVWSVRCGHAHMIKIQALNMFSCKVKRIGDKRLRSVDNEFQVQRLTTFNMHSSSWRLMTLLHDFSDKILMSVPLRACCWFNGAVWSGVG